MTELETAVAVRIANNRGGRRGMPPVLNVLDILPPHLLEEVQEDARDCIAAVREADGERVQTLRSVVDDVEVLHLIADEGGRAVGYASVRPFEVTAEDSGEAQNWTVLGQLWVQPDRRRRRWATRLVAAACRWADEVRQPLYLHVRDDNPARPIYEAAGFERYADRDERSAWYVRDPADAPGA